MPLFKRDMISKSASGSDDTRLDIRVSGGAPSPVLQEPDLQVGLVPYADTKILPIQEPMTWSACRPACPLPKSSWGQELQKVGTRDCINNITASWTPVSGHGACPEQGAPTCHIPHHLKQGVPPCSPIPCLRKTRKPTHEQCTVRAKLEQCN